MLSAVPSARGYAPNERCTTTCSVRFSLLTLAQLNHEILKERPLSLPFKPYGPAEIEVGDVVDYAQRISGITSAPPYWKPGMAMVGFVPPAPRPEMMRAGALSAFAVATGGLWQDRAL